MFELKNSFEKFYIKRKQNDDSENFGEKYVQSIHSVLSSALDQIMNKSKKLTDHELAEMLKWEIPVEINP